MIRRRMMRVWFGLVLVIFALKGQTRVDWNRDVKNKPFVDVKDYGAKGDGTTNDRVAIQAAIDAAPSGSKLVFSKAAGYKIWGSGSELLLISGKALNVECFAPIIVDSTVGASTDIIRVRGPIGEPWGIKGCLVQPNGGTPGRHVVELDTTSVSQGSHFIGRAVIERNYFGPFGGFAVHLTFPTPWIDGFFNSDIRDNILTNGISLMRSGDNVRVTGNTITGRNGLILRNVYGAGGTIIEKNSIVSCAPAMKIYNISGLVIQNNVIEPNIGADPSCTLQNGAVEIDGSATWDTPSVNGMNVGNVITNNTFVNIPYTSKWMIYLGAYNRNTTVTGNRLGLDAYWDVGVDTQPIKGIRLVTGVTNTFISNNSLDYTTDWTRFITDDSPGLNNNTIITNRDGALFIDNTVFFRPKGFPTWAFESNVLTNRNGLPFSLLTDPTVMIDNSAKMVYCTDCNVVSTPPHICTTGGTGAWAFFSPGPFLWKCPH